MSKVKATERQKHQEIAAYLAYMFTYGRRLQTRLKPLLGLTYCRRSATGHTDINHVGTRRRHLFLFDYYL